MAVGEAHYPLLQPKSEISPNEQAFTILKPMLDLLTLTKIVIWVDYQSPNLPPAGLRSDPKIKYCKDLLGLEKHT